MLSIIDPRYRAMLFNFRFLYRIKYIRAAQDFCDYLKKKILLLFNQLPIVQLIYYCKI